MLGAPRRTDRSSASFSSTCTSTSGSNVHWNDLPTGTPNTPIVPTSQRGTFLSRRRFILPIVPAAWLAGGQTSPRAAPLHDLCLPRQEPRPPTDVLNRSDLGSCSPSMAKFSRTSIAQQQMSTSTSTTTLPSSVINPTALLHPTMQYLTVNGNRPPHVHRHTHHCRHAR